MRDGEGLHRIGVDAAAPSRKAAGAGPTFLQGATEHPIVNHRAAG